MAAKTGLQWDQSQLKEKVEHGDVFFPIKNYSTLLTPIYPEVPMHCPPEMELTMISEGSADYAIDFYDYHVSAGDLICIQPSLLHAARISPKGFMRSESFVFHLNLLTSFSTDLCALRYFMPLMEGSLRLVHVIQKDDALYPKISTCFASLSDCCGRKLPGYELELKSLLFHLMNVLLWSGRTNEPGTDSVRSERLKDVLSYVREHYCEDISVDKAAEICHITPSHFMHFFKEKSGTSFNRYLNQYRLNQSALLLTQGVPAAEAAFACGFNQLSYFYRRFKEYYHMTPREFQKRAAVRPEINYYEKRALTQPLLDKY